MKQISFSRFLHGLCLFLAFVLLCAAAALGEGPLLRRRAAA